MSKVGDMRDDSGVALITVLGVIAVITVLAIGSYFMASQALHDAGRVESESKAFRAANSGLESALATFQEPESLLAGQTALYGEGSTPDGTYTITLANIGGGQYQLLSLGTGSDGTTETVAQRFFYMNLWEMNLAGEGPQSLTSSGANGLSGTTNILGPFYMEGTVDIGSNMSVKEGPFFVRQGNITVSGSGSIGEEDGPIAVFCDGSVPSNYWNGASGGVSISPLTRSVPDIDLPALTEDMMAGYALQAKVESIDNIIGSVEAGDVATVNLECDSDDPLTYTTMQPPNSATWSRQLPDPGSAFYKYIGPDEGPSAMGEGETDFVIGGRSFGSWGSTTTTSVALPGDGHYTIANSHDDFAYDSVNNVLYIEGTVFIDGDLLITEDFEYIGNGTIVVNGDITIDGNVNPYGTALIGNQVGEQNKWALGFVTPNDVLVTCQDNNGYAGDVDRDDIPTISGAFFVKGTFYSTSNILFRGSLIASNINSGHSNLGLVTNPLLPSYLPDSLPGKGGGLIMPGAWSRL